ncbi:MAG: GNAT family N-acetyltransferase [Archaeoglobales archaeon]|nr:GNAT family N-acetyltransferase [Archaeoglobales archaeon]
MKIERLRVEHLNEAVRVLALAYSNELSHIFGDLEIGRSILLEYFSQNPSGFVAVEDRVIGFANISFRKKSLSFFKFMCKNLGFSRGIRASLLLKFLCPDPKKGEATIDFIAVSPLKLRKGVASALMSAMFEEAMNKKVKRIKCLVPLNSLDIFENFGFKAEKLIESKFALKHVGRKGWCLMVKEL